MAGAPAGRGGIAVLQVSQASIRYGGVKALTDVSLNVEAGTIHSVIGPNGAGKTTLFNSISGATRLSQGLITLAETRIDGLPEHVVARHGLSRTFQNIRLFGGMTVLENVLVASEAKRSGAALFAAALNPFYSGRSAGAGAVERARELLDMVGLVGRAEDQARTLSYGDQRRLEIVRALATRPVILLLDEPAAGMNPPESARLTELIVGLRAKFGLTILLIEHHMRVVMALSQRISVLEYGRKIAEGTPAEIRDHPEVMRAYLGGRRTSHDGTS